MPVLTDIQSALTAGNYRITGHGAVEMLADDIEMAELTGEVIEDYPTAKPFPACLVLGHATPDRPVHAVWAYDASSRHAMLITTYRPDPARWSPDFRQRNKP